MSKANCIQKCFLLSILVLTFAAPAFADPVTVEIPVDELLHFQLVAKGGPINQPFQLTLIPTPTTPPSVFWDFQIVVAESEFQPTIITRGFDAIVVIGAVQHLVGPHPPEGIGTPLPFALFVLPFNANFPGGGNIGEVQQTSTFSVMHGPDHLDLLTATLIATVDRTGERYDITDWTLTVDAVHTPEPATMLLLGTGMIGVAMKLRKRR